MQRVSIRRYHSGVTLCLYFTPHRLDKFKMICHDKNNRIKKSSQRFASNAKRIEAN